MSSFEINYVKAMVYLYASFFNLPYNVYSNTQKDVF